MGRNVAKHGTARGDIQIQHVAQILKNKIVQGKWY